LYLASQSEAHVLLLCSSFAMRAEVIAHLQPSELEVVASTLHMDLLMFCIDVPIRSCEKKP
jgi:hypothetical protein